MELEFKYDSNRFFAEDESGKILAEITFPEKAPSVVELNHTYVDDSLRGQGAAGKLVKMTAEYAVVHGLKVIPTCSYAMQWFEKHPEYIDVIYADGMDFDGK